MTPRATVVAVNEPGAALSRLSAALQHEGYDVLVATSERDVPDLLRAHHVDCVVVPFESASGLAREYTATSGIPLLQTVPADDDGLVVRTLDAGADDCAPLSADFGVLKARLRALVRRKRLDEQRHAAVIGAVADKDAELVSLNYAISHDLRAPLRAIDGFSRILFEECAGTLEAKHADYLQRIGAAASELGVLIDDLLQLSRVGRSELRKGRVDLTELARRVAGDLQARSDRQVEVDVDAALSVYADRTLMRVALEHLIGNSWKFTALSAGPRIACRAQHADARTGMAAREGRMSVTELRQRQSTLESVRLDLPRWGLGPGSRLPVEQQPVSDAAETGSLSPRSSCGSSSAATRRGRGHRGRSHGLHREGRRRP